MPPTVFPAVHTAPAVPPSRLPGQPWGLDDAAEFLGVCRKTVENHIKQNRIATIRIGRRVLIPDTEVVRIASTGLTAA